MSKTTNCKNCESNFDQSFHYCPHCGQKSNDDLTMGVLFGNTVSNYFSVDARFFKSFIPLMFKPGVLARRFVDGKRLSYLHPAQFYLFISVIFFFLFSLVTRKQQQQFDSVLKKGFEHELTDTLNVVPIDQDDAKQLKKIISEKKGTLDSTMLKANERELMLLDSALTDTTQLQFINFSKNKSKLDSLINIKASKEEKLAFLGIKEQSNSFKRLVAGQALKVYEHQGGGILKSFYDIIPISMFFLLPFFALILKVLYFNKGRFAHHIVFSFYYFTFMFMVLSFIAFLNLLFDVPFWVDALVVFSTIFYLIISLWRFYRQHLLLTIFKSGVLSFTYMLIVIPISVVFMLFISFLLY